MIIRNPGTVFEFDSAAPSVAVSGSKSRAAHKYKYCPYSTQSTNYNQDSRVPQGQKTYHSETEGRMHSYSVSGIMGWVCADNSCSYFLGTATTAVTQHGRRFEVNSATEDCGTLEAFTTLSGSVLSLQTPRPIVPGIRQRYIEI